MRMASTSYYAVGSIRSQDARKVSCTDPLVALNRPGSSMDPAGQFEDRLLAGLPCPRDPLTLLVGAQGTEPWTR